MSDRYSDIAWCTSLRGEHTIDATVADRLLEYLRGDDDHLKQASMDTMAVFGTECVSAVPDVIALLWDESQKPWIRDTAAYALGYIGNDDSVLEPVIEVLTWHSVMDNNIGKCAQRSLDILTGATP